MESSHLHTKDDPNEPTPHGQVSVSTIERSGWEFLWYDNNVAPDIDPRIFGAVKLPVSCDFCGDRLVFAKDGQGSLIHVLDADYSSFAQLTHYNYRNVVSTLGQVLQAYSREGIEPAK